MRDPTRLQLEAVATSILDRLKPGCQRQIKTMAITSRVWTYMVYVDWWEGATKYTVVQAFDARHWGAQDWAEIMLLPEIAGRGEAHPADAEGGDIPSE